MTHESSETARPSLEDPQILEQLVRENRGIWARTLQSPAVSGFVGRTLGDMTFVPELARPARTEEVFMVAPRSFAPGDKLIEMAGCWFLRSSDGDITRYEEHVLTLEQAARVRARIAELDAA